MKKIIFSLVFVFILFITVIAFFLMLELGISVFKPRLSNNLIDHDQLNHIWRPNFKKVHNEWIERNPEYSKPYIHYYNAQSWLEKYDVDLKKPENVYRIFYLGDSFIEGTADMDQSVPGIVEKHLNQKYQNSKYTFEVINTGTSSYSPLIHYVNIKHYIRRYDPDVIVINVDMTDDFDDWKYRKNIIHDDDGDIWGVAPSNIYYQLFIDTEDGPIKATFKHKIHLFLYQNSHFYNWLLTKVRKTREKRRERLRKEFKENDKSQFYPRWAWVQHEWDNEIRENVHFTMTILEKIARYCLKKDIKLLLTGVPHYEQLNFKNGMRVWSRRPHDEIEEIAKKHNIVYFDSVEALERSVSGTRQNKYYYKGDMHFNPKGYALWAKAHIDAFENSKLKLLPQELYKK